MALRHIVVQGFALATLAVGPLAAQAPAPTDTARLGLVAVGPRAALSMGLVVGGAAAAGAAGGQVIGTPEAWGRTVDGFGRRVADQVGFLVVEETVRRSTVALTGWRTVDTPCTSTATGDEAGRRIDLGLLPAVRCGVARTLIARSRTGARRPNLPLLTGIVAGTAASLAWRPEGRAGGTGAATFVATRIAISVGATIAARSCAELLRANRRR